MSKSRFILLWPLWVLLMMQGCTPVHKSHVTITLKEGKPPVTLYFETLGHLSRNARSFKELLEKLENGEEVDLNKPLDDPHSGYGDYIPLEEAIKYALGKSYSSKSRGDKDFHAARYLLAKGADPNTAVHTLCSSLWRSGEVGKRGLVLLLSYGARLDIPYKDLLNRDYTPLKSLERGEPWIPQSLRKEYEKPKKEPASRVKEESVSSDEDEEETASQRSAWRDEISPEEQQRLKREYFTDIAEQLLKKENNRGNRLHPSFVKYLEEKTQVDKNLIEGLKKITAS